MQIVSSLSQSQKEIFHKLLFLLNPIVYVVSILLVVWVFLPVFIFLKQREKTSATMLVKAINLCVTGPPILAWVTTLGWGISAILFPALIHFYSPSLEPLIFFHFGVSFFLSWLIAMTYSYLNAQYFLVRKIYTKIWNISSLLKGDKQNDLKIIESRMKLFPFFAGAVPMIGALLLILIGYDKSLLIAFIVMGILGLGFALISTKKMLAVLYSFKG